MWARNAVSIPNHPKLIRELRLLERRTSRIGRDAVDHGRNGSDDYANSVVGVLVGLGATPRYDRPTVHGMIERRYNHDLANTPC